MSEFNIDYTSRDYDSLVTRADAFARDILPEWINRDDSDINWATVKTVAYLVSIGMFYIDLGVNEQDPYEVQIYKNALRLAKKYGMPVKRYTGAVASVSILVTTHASVKTIQKGTKFSYSGNNYILWEDLSFSPSTTDLTADVQYGEYETITVGVSNGTAYQIFLIPSTTVQDKMVRFLVNESGRTLSEDPSGYVEWTQKDSLIMSYKTDKDYRLVLNENEQYEAHFGDDLSGKQLVNGAIVIAEILTMPAAYVANNYGNIPAGNINTCSDSDVVTVTQIDDASGGTDKESISSIARNLPQWVSTADRCVSEADYRYVSRRVSGVEDAIVNQVGSNVEVYVIPSGGGVASTALKNKVADYLEPRRMPQLSVTVLNPASVSVNASVEITVLENKSRSVVRSLAYDAIVNLLSSPTEVGKYVTIQSAYVALNSVSGVKGSEVTAFYKATDSSPRTNNIQLANNEVSAVGTITIIATGGIGS